MQRSRILKWAIAVVSTVVGVYGASAQTDYTMTQLAHFGGWHNCVGVVSNHAYLCGGPSFSIIDVSTIPPSRVGSLGLPGEPGSAAVVGNLIYAASSGALHVIDASDQENPTILGTGNAPNTGWTFGVSVDGNLAGVVSTDSFDLYDVSNPASPEHKASAPGYAGGVVLRGQYAYVATAPGNVVVYNISDPTNPTSVGFVAVRGNDGLTLLGDHLYVANGWGGGIDVVNISNPLAPVVVGTYADSSVRVYDVKAHQQGPQTFVYALTSDNQLQVVDFTALTTPILQGSTPVSNSRGLLELVYPRLYIPGSGNDRALEIVNVSDPSNPAVADLYETGTTHQSCDVDGDVLVGCSMERMWFYDLSDPANPVSFASSAYSEWTTPPQSYFSFIDVMGNTAYAISSDGIYILDVSNPASVQVVGTFGGVAGAGSGKLAVSGDRLYHAGANAFRILDISAPATPTLMGELPGVSGDDVSLHSGGALAYVACTTAGDLGLKTINISDPNNPSVVNTANIGGAPSCLYVMGDQVYVGSNTQDVNGARFRLDRFDLLDPAAPSWSIGTLQTGIVNKLDFHEGVLFAAISGGSGVYTYSGMDLTAGPTCQGMAYTMASYSPPPTTTAGSPTMPTSADRYFYTAACSYGNDIQRYRIVTGGASCSLITLVSPAQAAQDGCTASPPSLGGVRCGSQVPVQASPSSPWNFENWTGAAGGASLSSVALVTANPSVAIANFVKPVLTLGGGGGGLGTCPEDPRLEAEVTSLPFTVSVNDIDDWMVNSITFKAAGSGDDSGDITKVKLYWAGAIVSEGTYSGDDGTVSLAVGRVLNAGSTVACRLVYEFAPQVSPLEKTYTSQTSAGDISAEPIGYSNYSKLPPPPVTSGPIEIASVWNENTDEGYAYIQDAVEDSATQDGHVLSVCEGTYLENVFVDKSLTIYGKFGREVTFVVSADGSKDVFECIKADTKLRGLTVRGAGVNKAGIRLHDDASTSEIKACRAEYNFRGILLDGVENCDVVGNEIANNLTDGVLIEGEATGNTVGGKSGADKNVISRNGVLAVHIKGTGTDDNEVAGNMIGTDASASIAMPNGPEEPKEPADLEAQVVAGLLGIAVVVISDGASENRIKGNVIAGNNLGAVLVVGEDTDDNTVAENMIGVNEGGAAALSNFGAGVTVAGGASGTTIEDNVISASMTDAVMILGTGTDDNTVEDNLIGTDKAGTTALANLGSGLVISGGAKNNVVDDNVISGNTLDAVMIVGSGTDGNTLEGNLVGTDKAGRSGLANLGSGLVISGGAKNNVVDDNVISGNALNAVMIMGAGTDGNSLEGNRIGTDKAGTTALANLGSGLVVSRGARNNVVDGNVVSGNTLNAVVIQGAGTSQNTLNDNHIGTDITGNRTLANLGSGVVVLGASGNDITDNVISGNRAAGVVLLGVGTAGNRVEDNRIGTSGAGSAALPNGTGSEVSRGADWGEAAELEMISADEAIGAAAGILVAGSAQNNVIKGNLVSGNQGSGIVLRGAGTQRNSISFNLIGANGMGGEGLPNGLAGIVVVGNASENDIAGNTVSGNLGSGVIISRAHRNVVLNNRIGTAPDGSSAVSNLVSGAVLFDAEGNVLRGNTVSAYGYNGVLIMGPNSEANVVAGNFVGTPRATASTPPNSLGGIVIRWGAHGNIIGGTSANDRNIIAGNWGSGVAIRGRETVENVVQGNYLGVYEDGTTLAPNKCGVMIAGGANMNLIGGSAAGAGNLIGGNIFGGVIIMCPNSRSNSVVGNAIGTDMAGTLDLGNMGPGVALMGTALNRVEKNRIAYNGKGILCTLGANPIDGNVIHRNGSRAGLHLLGSGSVVTHNTVAENAWNGILCGMYSQPQIQNNNIIDNVARGVKNASPCVLVNATRNWWGDASGPSGFGPGTGEGVGLRVDYANWLTTADSGGVALTFGQAKALIGAGLLEELPVLDESDYWALLEKLAGSSTDDEDAAAFKSLAATEAWLHALGAPEDDGGDSEPGYRPQGDFDGDGRTDICVFRPSTGHWIVRASGGGTLRWKWGVSGDRPVLGDYDGDTVADVAVFRLASGHWVVSASGGDVLRQKWGVSGDQPVPGDYDGDDITDLAVYRPSTGDWIVNLSSEGVIRQSWGIPSDHQSVPGDYNGDGIDDIAVYSPTDGWWKVLYLDGITSPSTVKWGMPGDQAIPADYDGDGATDMAVYRPTTGEWIVNAGSDGVIKQKWGIPGDQPVPGDYDGDGAVEMAVYRPTSGWWFILYRDGNPPEVIKWGVPGDVPVCPLVVSP